MATKTKYTAAYFIKFFSKIPKQKWTTGDFRNEKGQCCAYGHVGYTSEAAYKLYKLTLRLGGPNRTPISINDGWGDTAEKFGKTPKTRIINALKKVVQMERKSKKRKAA